MPQTPRSKLESWWEAHEDAVHQLAALFRIKRLKEFPLPPLTTNVAMERNNTSFETKPNWQNQNPDNNMTISEPGEQVWFIKGETLGKVLMELDQNALAKVFQYQLQQAGNPNPSILNFGQGTGRVMFSHILALSAYQPYTNMAVAAEGPHGERMIHVDCPRDFDDFDTDCTIITYNVLGSVASIADQPQISMIAARGGAFLPTGAPVSTQTGGGGFVNLIVSVGPQTRAMGFYGTSDELCWSISGVTGNVLDAGISISFQGHCATWKSWPAAGFWRHVTDYQNVLVQGVNFTLRNINNEAAVQSATAICVAQLKNPYAGWFIRAAMLGGTAFEFITQNIQTCDYATGTYGFGLHLGLLPINTAAYQDFSQMSSANQDGSQGITDVHYNLTGGSDAGTMRMTEVVVVIDCTQQSNISGDTGFNSGANALTTTSVAWLYYGQDPTGEARKATADPIMYTELLQQAGFYPLYERLNENGEVPPIGVLINSLVNEVELNTVAPIPIADLGGWAWDGGQREAKVRREEKSENVGKSRGSAVERAAARLQGQSVDL